MGGNAVYYGSTWKVHRVSDNMPRWCYSYLPYWPSSDSIITYTEKITDEIYESRLHRYSYVSSVSVRCNVYSYITGFRGPWAEIPT